MARARSVVTLVEKRRSRRNDRNEGVRMRKVFEFGGIATAAVLVVFGVVAIVMGFSGRNPGGSSQKQKQLVGTPDMTPAGIAAEVKKAGLTGIELPTCSVAGKTVSSGATARCFAQYMRIHTLEA